MSMNYDYAADCLFESAKVLKGYDSAELRSHASMLIHIAAELRKLAPKGLSDETLANLKPEPPKSDPNSMIPRPVPPPQGSGPEKVIPAGRELGNSHRPWKEIAKDKLESAQAQYAHMNGGAR